MELSIFIAQLYAIAFLALGLGLVLEPHYYQKLFKEMVKEPGVMMMGGFFALILGFIIVTKHNVWYGWGTLITLFGWVAVLKGVSLLVFPKYMLKWTENWLADMHFLQIWGLVVLMMGIILGTISFLG